MPEVQPVVKHNYLRFNYHQKATRSPGSKQGRAFQKLHRRAVDSLRYYQDRDRAPDEPERVLFTKHGTIERPDARRMMDECQGRDWLVHRIVLSPGPGRDGEDLRELARHVMGRLEEEREQELDWVATEHHNTEHPHLHILLFGGGRPLDAWGVPHGERSVVRVDLPECRFLEDETRSWCDRRVRERERWERCIERANARPEPSRTHDRERGRGPDKDDDDFLPF